MRLAQTERNKKFNWWEADQLVIYKHEWGVELRSTEKQLQLSGELSPRPLDFEGSRDGAVVRALASHQCGLGSIPGPGIISGLSLLLVLYSALRGFSSPGTLVFPSPQKPTFPNSNSILECTGISNEFLWTLDAPWVNKLLFFSSTQPRCLLRVKRFSFQLDYSYIDAIYLTWFLPMQKVSILPIKCYNELSEVGLFFIFS